ncbi:MAG: TetR/AcrR family transcriptional regulator [Anaerolineae bacterium]|nr:TetR/AcrR family transcriptional regulator [Anaerolineae bacterium]
MARTKEFAVPQAVAAAMELFWERGYEATAMRDISARTGVALSSLYATFGSKHDLYLAALAQYRQVERDEMAGLLADPRAVRETLAELFARLIDRLVADPARRGTFTLNAAVELGGQDEAVTAELRAHFDDIEVLLGRRLAEAQAEREIAAHFPPRELARFLLFGLYGLAMMVKVYPDRTQLERTAAVTLAVLDC